MLAGAAPTFASDMYSLGVILFCLMVKTPPVLENIRNGNFSMIPQHYSQKLVALCVNLLSEAPFERLLTSDVLGLPVIVQAVQAMIAKKRRAKQAHIKTGKYEKEELQKLIYAKMCHDAPELPSIPDL